ncbi:hypothetical protein HELRODRAFT_143065, partial [Helobdella robusta]|uniref:Uncharacterized protein n=1 Tax=Helobdella robusta TaxID=6412 RepID=T1EJ90_HELRO
DVILATSEEMRYKGTFETLKLRNQMERTALENGPKLIIQEMQYQEKCKKLIESIIDEKEQGQMMIKEREAQVASLKDYLKEQKVLRAYEMSYIKKFSEASLEQLKKMNDKQIWLLQEDERKVQQLIENDIKANEVMESFLKKEIESYQELLNWWTSKYEIDVEKKTAELKELKERREKDLEWQETLKKRIVEYEQVIEDDRRMKAIKQAEEDFMKLQNKKAIQIQAWWRGLRVRRCLGPFKKKKQKK